ncbi:MAG: ATP-binding cassette domain-containing protein, partial [Candidatus Caenarcaniphilales bacterium]|nr:ATP-binding cassette domain-containing protein [Candidatus Caenarcaniphilales bacterium]
MQLRAKNLHKKFKNFTAVKSFSFDLRPGEVLGLLGPNGAGKTTIIGMLYGGVIPTAGAIVYSKDNCDFNVLESKDLRKAKKFIGIVPQENNLDPDLSVHENLIVFCRYYGLTDSET